MVNSGKQGPYTWYQSKFHYLSTLLDQVPEIVVGKYVGVSAFDGQPMEITKNELRNGWEMQGQLALSPVVRRVTELPHNQLDEWFTFLTMEPFTVNERFVRCGGFSLVEPAGDNPFLPASARQTMGSDTAQGQRQKRFWQQINAVRPESYIAESDKLIVVSRNPEVLEQLEEFFNQPQARLMQQGSMHNKLKRNLSANRDPDLANV